MELTEIPYVDENLWSDYIRRLSEAYSAVAGLRDLLSRVVDAVNDRSLAEISKDPELLKMVLGGAKLDESPGLPEGSAAMFIRNVIGFGLPDAELSRLVTLLRRGARIEALRGVRVTVFNRAVEFLSRLNAIEGSLLEALSAAGVDARPNKYDMRAEELVHAFYDAINAIGSLLPTHDPLSFFIYSLSHVPAFYSLRQYPRLGDTEVSAMISRLRLKIMGSTLLPDPLGREELSIVGHGSPAAALVKALELSMTRDEKCSMVESYAPQVLPSALKYLGPLGRDLLLRPGEAEVIIDYDGLVSIRQLGASGIPYETLAAGLAPALLTHVAEVIEVSSASDGYRLRLRINRCGGTR